MFDTILNKCLFYKLQNSKEFPYEKDECYLAHCYPYTFSDLKNDIDELEYKTQKSKMLLRDYLCESRAGNTCFLLTITDFSNNYQLAFYRD